MGILQNLTDGFNNLIESLNKPIYSDQEVKLDQSKSSSQISTDREIENAEVLYNPFSSYVSSNFINTSVGTHNEYIMSWRKASLLPEVDEALTEISGEAICFDEKQDVIDLNLDDIDASDKIKDKIKESFQKIIFMLNFNEQGDELFRQWYVDGVINVEAIFDNKKIKEGIQKLALLTPLNLFKFRDENDGIVKYFYCNSPTYNMMKDLTKAEKIYLDDQITQVNSGRWDIFKKTPLSYLERSMKTINMLGLIEDSLIIFRITRSPERRVFYIDTGNLPKTKAEEYVRSLINKYRQKKIYNSDSGTIENKSRQVSILEDFWFPTSQGANGTRGTRVETLSGLNPGFNTFEDVDFFVNKLYKSLGIPFNRKNSESRLTLSNGVDIEKEEIKFFKFVLKLRRKFTNLFVDLMKKDLLAKQVFSVAEWNVIQEKIKFVFANSNEFSEIKRLQMLGMRMDAANTAIAFVEFDVLSYEYIQRNILMLDDEQIKEIKEQRVKEREERANRTPIPGEENYGMEPPAPQESAPEESGSPKPKAKNPFAKKKSEPKVPEETPKEEPKEKEEIKKESKSLPDSILEKLKDGDKISNGKEILIFNKGKFYLEK